MEMDSSRRSFDRSREPGPKKPRLAANEPRQFPLRPGLSQVQSRLARNADGDDPSGGGEYLPQPLPVNRELLEQYATALSELTFNSKPIITNLTIIAGENLHAAKAIASMICAHILEVPSDQKLPSLYLLDSIVKNIGRDYIKYFAVKLPEVFCKAYKQVEPQVRSSMRHLFGTWKGVFHPQMLQIIEKELGFGSPANDSPATTTSRSDSQAQRPAHSIHVNPKYLERQRLQQSARSKGTADDMDGPLLNTSEDIPRLERPTGITAGRPWAGSSSKIQRSLRDPRIDSLQNKKNIGGVYGDLEYGPDISRNSGLAPVRGGIKATEQTPWYGDDGGGVADTIPMQRNGFPVKNKIQGYPTPKSSGIDSQLSRGGGGMSASWKNSEEEEFSWDSMDSRLADRDTTFNTSSIPRKDHQTTSGSENLEFENHLPKTLSREGQSRIGLLETPRHTGLSDGYPPPVSRLPTSGRSISRTGIVSQVRSSSTGTSGQQRIQSLGSPSPSQSPTHLHSPPVDLAQHPPADGKTSQFSAKSSVGLSSRYGDKSFRSLSGVQSGNLKRPHPYESKEASSPVASFQPKQPPRISQPISAQPSSIQDSASVNSTAPSVETAQQMSASSLLAALAKSGSISAMLTNIPQLVGSQNKGTEASRASSKALSNEAQSSQLPFPMPNSGSSPGLATSHDTMAAASDSTCGKKTESEPEGSQKVKKCSSDPISSLLSSLVAKGLISAAKRESTAPMLTHAAELPLKEEQEAITTTSEQVSSASISSEIVVSATADEVSTPKQVAKISQPPAATEEIKNLIGFEFRPEVLKNFHSSVIDDLFDGFPYQCDICGLRLKLKERLDRHLVWHASHNSEQKDAAAVSTKWYVHASDWVAGRMGNPMSGAKSVKEEEKSFEASESNEPMVPADESQCACVICGDLFEDFYDIGKDEWMFRGASYMNIPCGIPEISAESSSKSRGLVVHAKCLPGNSLEDLGLHIHVKKEEDA